MGRYDLKAELDRLFGGMFDATISIDLHRLPELFCGFARRPSIGPTSYPVACSPQAWSSATVFGLLGGCLGISFDAEQHQVSFRRPILPSVVNELVVRGLSLQESSIDLLFRRHIDDVSVNVLSREGDLKVMVTI
jgi:glycogen debranching enzyme